MTMVEVRSQAAPVTFRRTVLVGVDDPLLDSVPPIPAPPLTVDDEVSATPVAESVDGSPRVRLVAGVLSVTVLLAFVGVLAWFRFGEATHLAGVSGPTPTVSLDVPTTFALSDGADVTVELGTGAPPERVDLFVDGDWVGEDHEAPDTPEWEHRSAGDHELKAKVTDVDGRIRYSDPVEVTIAD
jgi:hypothetical protein